MSEPEVTPTTTEKRPLKSKAAVAKDTASPKGLHDAKSRDVRLDDYPERTYAEAMTSEQKQALKDAGLL